MPDTRFGSRLLPAIAPVLAVSLGACATTQVSGLDGPTPSTDPPAWSVSVLDAALWMQTSSEYSALSRQTWSAAGRMLPIALADTSWTAALEQRPGYGTLPPAVIVDVDETMLDNSPYAARLIQAREGFSQESWSRWVNEAVAREVPGASEFAQLARELGIEVFYVTNRNAELEDGTRRNLLQEGFPAGLAEDVYLLRRERDEWGSDKTTRRAFVAANYRVLLLAGDDLNDFVSGARSGREPRAALVAQHAAKWGSKWFVLANPTYGSWEAALTFGESGLTREEVVKRKLEALDPAESR